MKMATSKNKVFYTTVQVYRASKILHFDEHKLLIDIFTLR